METETTANETATLQENLITSIFSTWLIVGLFVDGWAHNNLPELETFWTPWHGLFYSGFVATGAWIVWMVRRRLITGTSMATAIPAGYRAAVVGLGVFAAGGAGDAIWHTLFGIETDVDALFSPTHILLVTGIMLIVTAPIRSMMGHVPTRDAGRGEFLPIGIAATLALLLVSFFTMYAYAPTSGVFQVAFVPGRSGGFEAVFGVLLILVTTIITSSMVLWLSSRWRVPFGTYTAMLGVIGVLMSGMLDEFSEPWEVVPMLAAGLTADLLVHRLDPTPSHISRWLTFGAGPPLVMWLVHFALFASFRELGWPPELWGGVPILGAMAGATMAFLIGDSWSTRPPAPDSGERAASSYR